jgi:hypothetical protein
MKEILTNSDLLRLKVGDVLHIDGTDSELVNSGSYLISGIRQYEISTEQPGKFIKHRAYSFAGHPKIYSIVPSNSALLPQRIVFSFGNNKDISSLFRFKNIHNVRLYMEED